MSYGGLATTWKGRRGSRRSRAIGLHHGHRRREATSEFGGTVRVRLDGDHPVAVVDEWGGDGAESGADVEDQG